IELISGFTKARHDGSVVGRKGARVDPRADRHAAGHAKCGGSVKIDVLLRTVQTDGAAVDPVDETRAVHHRAVQTIAGRVDHDVVVNRIEGPLRLEASGSGGTPVVGSQPRR